MDHYGADDEEIAHGYKYLGHNISNNQAEYKGLIMASRWMCLTKTSCHRLYIRGDSQLVINQLDGLYQVRSSRTKPYYSTVREEIKKVTKPFVSCKHIDRSRNCRADHFANYAINTKGEGTVHVAEILKLKFILAKVKSIK